VAVLLNRLREAGADEQAAVLVTRLPTVGMFEHFLFFAHFLREQGSADQFHFGCEADGTPAARWEWEDPDLWLVA
jgi:hypothetical protein